MPVGPRWLPDVELDPGNRMTVEGGHPAVEEQDAAW